jgi:hypothetical protein
MKQWGREVATGAACLVWCVVLLVLLVAQGVGDWYHEREAAQWG